MVEFIAKRGQFNLFRRGDEYSFGGSRWMSVRETILMARFFLTEVDPDPLTLADHVAISKVIRDHVGEEEWLLAALRTL